MYDTVRLKLRVSLDEDYLERLSDKKGLELSIKPKTGEIFVFGEHGNLRVRANQTGIRLEGSLAKYYYGNNFETLTIEDTQRVIEKLSDEFGLLIKDARVTRLDIGANLVMEHPIYMYQHLLSDSRHYPNKLLYPNSITYFNDRRSFTAYDKTKEATKDKKKPQVIPDYFKDKYVLRIELRYKGKIKEQLEGDIKASDLYNPKFYVSMVELLQQEYLAINKKYILRPSTTLHNIESLLAMLCCLIAEYMGRDYLLAVIDKSTPNKQQKARLKLKVRKAIKDSSIVKCPNILTELDNKVQDIVNSQGL